MDQNTLRLQHALLLPCDLSFHALVIAAAGIGLPKLRGAEQPAVLHSVKRCVRQEVERATPAKIDTVVLERLAGEVAAIERDRFGAKLEQQSREPRLEECRPPTRRRRPARVRARGDVEDPLPADARERRERTLQALDEFLEDGNELGFARALAAQPVVLVELRDRPR